MLRATRRLGQGSGQSPALGRRCRRPCTPSFRSRLSTARAPGPWPPFFGARRLLVRPHGGAVEEHLPKRGVARVTQIRKGPLPDAHPRPADVQLCRLPPGTKLRWNRTPLRPVALSPNDGFHRSALVNQGAPRPRSRHIQRRFQPRPIAIAQDLHPKTTNKRPRGSLTDPRAKKRLRCACNSSAGVLPSFLLRRHA